MVPDAQVAAHALPADPAGLHRLLHPAGVGGRLTRVGGELALGFGKHRGRPLAEVAVADPGDLRWLLRAGGLLPDAADMIAAECGLRQDVSRPAGPGA